MFLLFTRLTSMVSCYQCSLGTLVVTYQKVFFFLVLLCWAPVIKNVKPKKQL
jgi:1,4-dihydroxy-2-naphthoate octaprenyltransferase